MTEKGTTRMVQTEIAPEVLAKDLERYCHEALEQGASAAEIISANWISIDERVRLKCLIPRCFSSGRCAECPPLAPELELIRGAISRYTWAILIRHDIVPPTDVADAKVYEDASGWKHYAKMAKIVAKIETLAFADAYHLTLGFAAGCCRGYLCHNQAICQVIDSGICRHPLMARPSMEACGMDAFGIAAKVGWEMYPIYATVDPTQVPSAALLGIVFVC
jgi:predicted metal-binding protein